jgi:hypothetical protein
MSFMDGSVIKMKIKRKEYERLIQMRDMRIIINSPAGELLNVSCYELAIIHGYGGVDGMQMNGPITLRIESPEPSVSMIPIPGTDEPKGM